MPAAPTPEERRGPGRPRKWASEAERVRAYRQRKAEEQADADGLRVERRQLRRQVSDAMRGWERAEAAARRAEARADKLANEVEHLRRRAEQDRATIERLRQTLQQPRLTSSTGAPAVEPRVSPARPNRAQRRRETRKR